MNGPPGENCTKDQIDFEALPICDGTDGNKPGINCKAAPPSLSQMLPWCSDKPGVHGIDCRSSLPVCDGLNGVEGKDCRKSEMEVQLI